MRPEGLLPRYSPMETTANPILDPASLGPANPMTDLMAALAPPAAPPITAPGTSPIRQALKNFTSDLMYTLATSLSASASQPGQRGTAAGLAQAIAGPTQRRTLIQEADEERQRKDAEARRKEEAHQSEIAKRDAETADMKRAALEKNHVYILRDNPATGAKERVLVYQDPIGGLQEQIGEGFPMGPAPAKGNIDPLSPEGIAAQKEIEQGKPKAPHNIDPNSPEGIAARLEFERRKPKESPAADGTLSPKQLQQSLQLTNSLKSHPAYNDMLDIATGMQGVAAGLSQKNGFGDITAINSFQRMADPGATVREGDVALLQSAIALKDRILSEYPLEKLKTGAKLPDATRDEMLKMATDLYERRAKNYNSSVGEQYRKLSKAGGIPFEYIGVDFPSMKAGGESGNGMIRVRLNGRDGEIPESQWDAFKKDNPSATR